MKTDRIDLYWAHYDDGVTPMEEIVAAFDDLVAAGKILYGGLSNFAAWRVARGQTIAELRGRSPLVGIQVEHSLVERTAERDLLPMAEALGLGAMLYSPLGGGLLTAKHRAGREGGRPSPTPRTRPPRRRSSMRSSPSPRSSAATPGRSRSRGSESWRGAPARRW